MRQIAAENDRRRRWPDDEVAWTCDQWRRFIDAMERTRGGELLAGALYQCWSKVRGYLEADLNADEIHRALRSDAQVFDVKARSAAESQRMLPLTRSRVAAE